MKKVMVVVNIMVMVCFFLAYGNPAFAAAVNPISGIGAKAKGMGGAGLAAASDASCFYYNPSLLTQAGNFAQIGTDYIEAGIKYKDSQGGNHTSDPGKYFVPLSGINYKSANNNISFGLGIETPYIFGSDFKKEFDMFSKLSLTNIAPAIAYRLTDNFSLGAAVKLGFGQMKIIQPFFSDQMDKLGVSEIEADGWGYSWQVGTLWQPNDWFRLGATYQSKARINMDGDAGITSSLLGNSSDTFSTTFYFPARLGAGIGLELDPFLIAADVIWFDYSSNDKVDLDYKTMPDQEQDLKWNNTTFYGLGIEYARTEYLKLRTGLCYQAAVIPDETCNPVTPDVDGWGITGGFGWQGEQFGFSLAYLHVIDKKNKVTLPYAGAGEYKVNVDTWSAAISYLF